MKVLVIGVNGQLGFDVINELKKKRNHDTIGVDIQEMNITHANSIEKVIGEAKPNTVIHCAAWTDVNLAEGEDKIEKVRLVNVTGAENIQRYVKHLDCKRVYISKDYVFDGHDTRSWKPDDERNQLNVYRQTKYEGELAVEKWIEKYFNLM